MGRGSGRQLQGKRGLGCSAPLPLRLPSPLSLPGIHRRPAECAPPSVHHPGPSALLRLPSPISLPPSRSLALPTLSYYTLPLFTHSPPFRCVSSSSLSLLLHRSERCCPSLPSSPVHFATQRSAAAVSVRLVSPCEWTTAIGAAPSRVSSALPQSCARLSSAQLPPPPFSPPHAALSSRHSRLSSAQPAAQQRSSSPSTIEPRQLPSPPLLLALALSPHLLLLLCLSSAPLSPFLSSLLFPRLPLSVGPSVAVSVALRVPYVYESVSSPDE